jgi:multiple sugar transport system ATP-binding protein
MAAIHFDNVTKRFDDGTLAVDGLSLAVPDGEFLTLVGPSGCGKTTALRMVAGLEDITEGSILLGDRVVNEVEPADRDVAMVFQNYALFPHLTVEDNVGFPLRMRGVPKAEARARVTETTRMLGLDQLLKRRPSQLSGGQRQRVAMGRAIVRHPEAFLMDEPLSNLDAKLRGHMRAELARLHLRLGVTTLYVTHDQTEAMTLGSRIAVMRGGLLQQAGGAREVYTQPANAFVARFIGTPPMNLFEGRIDGGPLTLAGAAERRVELPGDWRGEARDVLIGVRPEALRVDGDASATGLVLDGEIEVVEDLGADAIVHFRDAGAVQRNAPGEDEEADATLAARLDATRGWRPGERLRLNAAFDALHLFDARTGQAIDRPGRASGRPQAT